MVLVITNRILNCVLLPVRYKNHFKLPD